MFLHQRSEAWLHERSTVSRVHLSERYNPNLANPQSMDFVGLPPFFPSLLSQEKSSLFPDFLYISQTSMLNLPPLFAHYTKIKMSTPSTMTNRTPTTQVNDVSPNGSQVTIPWDTWCKSFRERPNISSKDIQIEIAIREEAQKKLWKNHPVCQCFDRSVQKSKALMERLLWRVEVTVHGARKCLRKQRGMRFSAAVLNLG